MAIIHSFKALCFYITFITFLAPFTPAAEFDNGAGEPNDPNQNSVTIELTKLDVNDTTLELRYKIKNNTDHDVWICDSVYSATRSIDTRSTFDFEVYLSEDEQSLLIRRRLDVPTAVVWAAPPSGQYVRLQPGQEYAESLSLAVPVYPRRLFTSGRATSDHARRLVLEIGFYNEDLPKLIRDILEMAEKLNCARLEPSEYTTAFFRRYFKGIWIAHQLFGGLSDFEQYTYKEGSEEIEIPYTRQNFNGEQVLRIEVDGVHIPYEEVPGADATAKGDEGKLSKSYKPGREKPSVRNDTDKS